MIRAAIEADADWITALWNDVISGTTITFTSTLKTPADIARMIATRPVLVLEDAGGFATFGPFRSGPGYAATVEHSIFLSPKARGLGQGSALMRRLMATARDAGHHVMVAAISGDNAGAVAFHAGLGFEMSGHLPQVGRKDGRWLDLILMQKLLTASDDANIAPADPV
ncbi:GNAT family N-acetyltransferase [uncultured Tateyamaria sp.]|uniref:GNAT family N-acetyltransferase n=1 Tax=uncultured Tateyamaria sp. TaxID=455651 RepID=UPI002621BF50|nr:GNAT family N-acetyltransferase [uncultured Tateyamaria sp.]